ncbi:MAG: adenylosuccinate synthase [Candidatus Thorarchaeota archaeon]
MGKTVIYSWLRLLIMNSLVVIGLQWGDEGKGKIVDFLSENFDIVARFQGGSNAGHTVIVGDEVHKFRIVPTGAVRGKSLVIGNGVVVDPVILWNEIEQLQTAGIDVNLLISDRSHLITPFHIQIDGLQETSKGEFKVGTTKRGIGPTYADKVSRLGVRFCDFRYDERTQQWNLLESSSKSRIEAIHKAAVDLSSEVEFFDKVRKLQHYVGDSGTYLDTEMNAGKRVLFEGAQGTLLDIDHGTYPFVTSSNCVSANASIGTGISFSRLDSVMGVCKAYVTRVGTGPFPTEQENNIGQHLRDLGKEYGTVTGRPRRCGWLDMVALKYAARINGCKYLALTKADVLTGLDPLKICIAYDYDGSELNTIPANAQQYSEVTPVYEELKGWSQLDKDISFEKLPSQLMEYLSFIERETIARVAIVSVGPERSQTIVIPGVLPRS